VQFKEATSIHLHMTEQLRKVTSGYAGLNEE
jgi:hypothetical protein